MKVTGIINVLAPTERGISKSTGRPWACKELVIEFKGEGFFANTMAMKCFNEETITKLEGLNEGLECEFDFITIANAREVTRADGSKYLIRSTDITLIGVTYNTNPL